MTYQELQETILAKLNLTAEEAKYDNILTKIPNLCNEALGDIANRGKPLYKTLIVDLTTDTVTGALLPNEIVSASRFITFPSDFISLTNEYVRRIPITVVGGVIVESDISNYLTVEGRYFRRMSSRQLLFPNDFGYRYLVPTVCRYPKITLMMENIDIEESVVELLPNYVIAELLRSDDLTTSMVYRNLYETSLSALNDSVLSPTDSFYNEDF